MHERHGAMRGWLIFLIVFLGAATAFLIWYFIIRDNPTPQSVTTVSIEYEEEEDDGAPDGLDWYHNDEANLHFLHPEGWNLYKREFGNAPNVDLADVSLTASDFNLSYFEDRDTRVILDLPEERFCEETKNLKRWDAFIGAANPQSTSDDRCSNPELLLINNYLSPAFEDDTENQYSYSIFLPFSKKGGMVFSDSVPIPENATVSAKGTIVENLKSNLRSKVSAFTNNNQPLLNNPQPSDDGSE